MGLLSKISSWWSPPQDQVRHENPYRLNQILVTVAPSGVKVTNDNVLELSAVWGCVMALANGIGSSPWVVVKGTPNHREVLDEDPLTYLLNTRPNDDMTAINFREAMMFNATTWGNAYAEIVRDLSGRIVSLYPLMPDRMYVRRDDDGTLFYEYHQQDGGRVRLESREVFHLRGPGCTGLMGDNLVARAAKTMGLAAAQERFASTYFGNNTVLGGFLEYPKTLDDKTFKHIRDTWEDKFRGPNKSNKPAILEGGAKWTPIANNAEGAQLEQGRKFQLEEICRWFGVPPHKVQHLDRATFNNIEHLAIEFVRDGLVPWKIRLEQEADYKLFAPRSTIRKTYIDVAPLTQGDFKSRAEGYQIMRRIGVYSVNDIRHKEGDNTIGPEGDVRIVEVNMQTIDQLTAQTEPPIFDYHIKAGIPTINEVRERLALPPVSGGDKPANQLNPGQDAETHDDKTKVPPPKLPAAPGSPSEAGGGPPALPGASRHLLHDTIVALFASAFDRYSTELVTSEVDLRREGAAGSVLDAAMANARAARRPGVLDESRAAIDLVMKVRSDWLGKDRRPYEVYLLLALDGVDNGVNVREAADRMVHNLLYTDPREVFVDVSRAYGDGRDVEVQCST